MSKHHISYAGSLSFGSGYTAKAFAANERSGVPFQPLTKVSLGSPVLLDADGIVKAATSTEMPNASTITYTTATDTVSPLDGAIAAPSTVFLNGADRLVWVLDVPRNITTINADSGTTAALTITVTGYDVYGQPMTETITSAATATSIVADGLKAFKYVYSIAITSAANATANTLNIGWGDVLGLPYRLVSKSDLLATYQAGVIDAVGTVVVAVDTTATATTGDVRGTIDPTTACNGVLFEIWAAFDPSTTDTLFGVTQA